MANQLQPVEVQMTGVIGGTLNNEVTIYTSSSQYQWYGVYQPSRTYPINSLVVASDGNLYASLNTINVNDNPVTDTTNWSIQPPTDLTQWSSAQTVIVQGEVTETGVATLGGTAGTIGINYTSSQTSNFIVGSANINVSVVDPLGNLYFAIIGTVNFISPTGGVVSSQLIG